MRSKVALGAPAATYGREAASMNSKLYLAKAQQCLAGAELAAAHGQYNNAANRAYYAAFQAAIALLTAAAVQPPSERYWGHDFVLREYCRLAGPSRGGALRGAAPATLKALQDARLKADYDVELIGEVTGLRAVALAGEFVGAVSAEVAKAEEVVCPSSPTPARPRAPSPP